MSYRDWHVGMHVVCIASSARWLKPNVIGKVYTLRAILKHPKTGEIGVHLEGVENAIHPEYGIECGYFASSFRPLDESRLDIFRAHLSPSPKQKERA